MRELILGGLAFILQFTVFISIGSILMYKLKLKKDLSMALILGYITYFSFFGIFMIPFTLMWVSLSTSAKIWAVIMVLCVGMALFLFGKNIKKFHFKDFKKSFHWFAIVVLAVVFLQCLIVVFYQDVTVDATYYVGQVSTSVYTDTLQRYDPYTGSLLKKFSARYVFSSYPMHNAVWCRLIGMHAIVQSKIVMSAMNVLVANAVIYQIGKRLFKGNRGQAGVMVCVAAFLQLFSYTIFTPGTFFFTRCYEGKAILGNVSMVLVFYCGIWFWQESQDKRMWLILLLTNISAITFSGSAIIMPAAVSAAILPGILKAKKCKNLLPYIVVMLPSILYMAVYLGTRFGLFVLKAS